ncbi:MAG: ATP synthase F1 subunit gamma [Clostridia bacterium]|nr:MAG: ATP synthase F1 subunit gamma [Clostridia bacterium]
MATMRDIRRRIRSIENTRQITRAMQMVAAAKLRKTQERVLAARPYSETLRQVLERVVASAGGEIAHPLLASREVRRVGLVVLTADRGLCGGYSANVIRAGQQFLTAQPAGHQPQLVVVGRKGWDYYRRRGHAIFRQYLDIGDDPNFIQARELARELVDLYTSGAVDSINIAYTQFFSPGRQRPQVIQFLPIGQVQEKTGEADYLYEPAPRDLLAVLLPRYVETLVYQVLLDAKASEHAARMVAMESATKNAGEMIETLTLTYNKARQAAITKEITEIVGGVEALAR